MPGRLRGLLQTGRDLGSVALRRTVHPGGELGRGLALVGTVWAGGEVDPGPGTVILDGRGVVRYLGPQRHAPITDDLPILDAADQWIGPGVIDTHVHAQSIAVARSLAGGVVAMRDLAARPDTARRWRTGHRPAPAGLPFVAVAGPVLTAPRGYPSRSWGPDGTAVFVASPSQAREIVHRVAVAGADVIALALEEGDGGWPVPSPQVVRAVVDAAHGTGLAVVAHLRTVEMLRRAVRAGVDELAQVPIDRLGEDDVERIAAAGVSVVSTLQRHFSTGRGRDAAANAAALARADVVLRYGTGRGGPTGVDPRELDRIADTGLGRLGALRAATCVAAAAPGFRAQTGLLQVGRTARLVVLPSDPLAEPGAWRAPRAVVADGRLTLVTQPGLPQPAKMNP